MNGPQYIRVGSLANFTANVVQGHSLDLTWNWVIDGIHINKTIQTNNKTSQSTQIFNISKAGQIEISITVKNGVSSSSNSCSILSLYPIDGYELYSRKNVYNTTDTAWFGINDTETKLPVGLVNVKFYLPLFLEIDLNDSNVCKFEFEHKFEKQGIYEVLIELRSEIEVKNISMKIDIWDELVYLQIKPSKMNAKVGENISIDLQNPPPSNFHYNLSFGDGNEENKMSGNFSESFRWSPHVKNYNKSGLYIISIVAWNGKYKREHSVTVYIQYPLHLLSITPDKYSVPLPDGLVDFTIRHNGSQLPTNVTCTVDYGDRVDIKKKNNVFKNTNLYFLRLEFTNPGQHRVNVSCKNDVSFYHLEPHVNVTKINMSDISVVFQNPSQMNMSRNAAFPYTPIPVPTNVTFKLVLFNCSRLPFDMDETWKIVNYGETKFNNKTDFTRILSFEERNTFELNVEFKLKQLNDYTSFKRNITLGKMKLNSKKTMINFKEETFNITLMVLTTFESNKNRYDVGFSLESDYEVQIIEDKPAQPFNLSKNTFLTERIFELKYNKYGFYMPKFSGNGNDFIEEIYLDKPLIAEFDLENKLEFHTTAEKNNDTVNLPPGNINFTISSDLDETLPWVNCTLTSGDEVKRFEYKVSHNITRDSPIVVSHTYGDLGYQTIKVTCINFISSVSFTKKIDVINSCFGDEGIFDRKFSMPEVRMKITDTSEVYIANRMSVFCNNYDIIFAWKSCESLPSRKGVCLFNEAKKLTANNYNVTLNVSIPRWKTYIYEPMFVEVIPSVLVAYIDGSDSRIAFVNDNITFKALGNNIKVRFEWDINR